MKNITNTGSSVYFSHVYKQYARILQTRKKKVLDENQPIEQADFRKGHSTLHHLQTINQLIEKCHELKRPLCVGYIDYEKAFDSTEHEGVFKALRSIDIDESCITIIEDIYKGAT